MSKSVIADTDSENDIKPTMAQRSVTNPFRGKPDINPLSALVAFIHFVADFDYNLSRKLNTFCS